MQNALKVVQERVLNALPIPFFNADERGVIGGLAYKESDKRKSLREFIDILLKLYKEVGLLKL